MSKTKELEVPKEIVEVGGDEQDDEDADPDAEKEQDVDGADGEGEPEGRRDREDILALY